MPPSNRKIVHIAPTPEQRVLSKAQKQFNTLTQKIDAEKQRLLEWQEAIPKYNRKVSKDYEVQVEAYNAERIKMAQLLDRAYESKLFKKTDRAKIQHLICEITAELIGDHGKAELKDLHDKYSDVDVDFDTVQQETDAIAGDFLKTMMEDLYGVEIEEDIDLYSPEKMEALLHEKLKEQQDTDAERQRQREERRHKRQKTAKQLEREAQQQEEEQSISQSIREVYRKLTSALHPDREQDPVERTRKTEIMQRVNAAYTKKDLLRLLELQLEAEQIDQAHMNNIAEDRLKYIRCEAGSRVVPRSDRAGRFHGAFFAE
jgi:hypothetical protein